MRRAELGGRTVQRRLGGRGRQRGRVGGLADRLESVEALIRGGRRTRPPRRRKAPCEEAPPRTDQPSPALPSSGGVTLLLAGGGPPPGCRGHGGRGPCSGGVGNVAGAWERDAVPGTAFPCLCSLLLRVHSSARCLILVVLLFIPISCGGTGLIHRLCPGPSYSGAAAQAPPPHAHCPAVRCALWCRTAPTIAPADRRTRSRSRLSHPEHSPFKCGGRGHRMPVGAPATTPARRCRASRATWPSPAIAPRTSTPSANWVRQHPHRPGAVRVRRRRPARRGTTATLPSSRPRRPLMLTLTTRNPR